MKVPNTKTVHWLHKPYRFQLNKSKNSVVQIRLHPEPNEHIVFVVSSDLDKSF